MKEEQSEQARRRGGTQGEGARCEIEIERDKERINKRKGKSARILKTGFFSLKYRSTRSIWYDAQCIDA